MQYLSLLLQVATLGLVAYLLLQFKALVREVRTPVVRQKGQLPADFRDRLRNVARPGAEAPKAPENRAPEARADRGEIRGDRDGRDRDRNRDGRDRDRNRDGRDRDRNRDGRDRGENRGERGENRGDRDRNRDGRDRGENRGDRPDRGPRPPRPEGAAESAPVVASEESAPVVSAAPAPSFGGRRPLGPQSSSEGSSVENAPLDALAPSSLAQPVISDAPIRHGRRALPKAKPRFDDDDAPEA